MQNQKEIDENEALYDSCVLKAVADIKHDIEQKFPSGASTQNHIEWLIFQEAKRRASHLLRKKIEKRTHSNP